jgi:hypothetical protein
MSIADASEPRMNRYQRLLVIVAAIDVLLTVLFPPFSDRPLLRGASPNFSGFLPLFSALGQKPLHVELLTLQLMFIVANLLAGILALRTRREQELPRFGFGFGIGCFAFVNLAILLLFPPFTTYSSVLRVTAPSFDGFYFVWGNRSARPIYVPLLYLELVFVTVNALALYLVFGVLRRSDDIYRRHLVHVAASMSPQQLARLSETMRRRLAAAHAKDNPSTLGRHEDRRRAADPGYRGPERRKKQRRTH